MFVIYKGDYLGIGEKMYMFEVHLSPREMKILREASQEMMAVPSAIIEGFVYEGLNGVTTRKEKQDESK